MRILLASALLSSLSIAGDFNLKLHCNVSKDGNVKGKLLATLPVYEDLAAIGTQEDYPVYSVNPRDGRTPPSDKPTPAFNPIHIFINMDLARIAANSYKKELSFHHNNGRSIKLKSTDESDFLGRSKSLRIKLTENLRESGTLNFKLPADLINPQTGSFNNKTHRVFSATSGFANKDHILNNSVLSCSLNVSPYAK